MTLYNNASITFNARIHDEAMEKICENNDDFREAFLTTFDGGKTVLEIDEWPGDLRDDLNKIVEILKPYGIVPLFGEYNRYYGDYDGYDVFTGEHFESMDDVDYGKWLIRSKTGRYDDLIRAATELVDYFRMHNKNTTKAQDEKVENLRHALDKLSPI